MLVGLVYLAWILGVIVTTLPVDEKYIIVRNTSINSTSKKIHSEYANFSLELAKLQIPKDFNLSKIAKDLKSFGIHSLKDDHHLEGLPLDRHGKVNPEFHRELFLGNHELFESNIQHDEMKRNKKLEEIFRLADIDHDERVTREELVSYLFKNVQDHLKEAKDKNAQLFILIDTNNDGKVTWPEYAALYLKLHNQNVSVDKYLYDMDTAPQSIDLDLLAELLRIRNRWMRVGDNLNIDQFLAFRHPELVSQASTSIADNLMAQLDRDNDQQLTEKEFIIVPSHDINGEHGETKREAIDQQWMASQKREFLEFDENHDGILSKEELVKAYDPMNRAHINIQVNRLFEKVDDSPRDDTLSLNEIQRHAHVFADMRILDTDEVLHDEM
ncbi:unnamed protein product [Adineta ricciae]|uniref:EF-hand domain-containing protein n=1 Tax=Adineta ricciae TaxID=249248 RepID=A0A814A401_ADIRI|nr:unnamed protein product [Adineta ricciae]